MTIITIEAVWSDLKLQNFLHKDKLFLGFFESGPVLFRNNTDAFPTISSIPSCFGCTFGSFYASEGTNPPDLRQHEHE